MLKNLMEDKRLDLDAPLLSVRRYASESDYGPKPPVSAAAAGAAARSPNPRRSALPFYKSDLKSGPIHNPGVVPFVWEQSPGRPKNYNPPVPPSAAPKLPPGRILAEKESTHPSAAGADNEKKESLAISEERCDDDDDDEEEEEEEEEEKFSDALETLSRTESYFMNCSISGLSEMTERVQPSGTGSFSTDPQVRDFMMGRFLPAAKAAATASPHSSSRKLQAAVRGREPMRVLEERVDSGEQRRVRFPNGANFAQEVEGASCSYDNDEEEEEMEYFGNGHLSNKGCGFLTRFCSKSSFCLLNPVPGLKVSGQRLPPTSVRRIRGLQVKSMQNGSLGQAEEEYSWEAVYKHKLMHGDPPPRGEDGSNLMSESNRLTYCSDSLTADGSSPQCRSNISGISPYRNEPSQSPFREGKGFLGVPRKDRKSSKTDGSDSFEKDNENCWVVTPHHSSQGGSGSMSPAVERTLHVDTVHMPETPMSKSSSLSTSSDNKGIARSADEDSEVAVQSQRMDGSVLGTLDEDALQSKVIEVNKIGPTLRPETSACGGMNENNGFKPSDEDDSPLSTKENNHVKNDADLIPSLLPPPLPNSPSESWLSRALPSVSLKNPSSQSFLGVHVQASKKTSSSLSTVPKRELTMKPPKVQHVQTRFADMLAKPLSPQSEI